MLSVAERHKYILDHLNKYGFVRITDVANELGVTKVTIRKDVKILEAKGLLYKVHGSARSANPHVADTDVHVKGNVNREEKERIARKAVELLNDNDSIIMASGSTIYAFAEAIKREFRSHLNVVTTFLKTSVLLNDVEEINVVQLGGCVHKKSLSAIGGYAEAALSDFSCSKLFFGVDGIDLEHGITTSTIEEAKLTQVMMRSASKIIILADSSKFGQRGFGRGTGGGVSQLTTDGVGGPLGHQAIGHQLAAGDSNEAFHTVTLGMVEQDDAAADAAPVGIVIAGHQRADAGVGAEDPGAAHDRRQLFPFAQ